MEFTKEQKFEAVRYRHQDQSLLSQKLIDVDLKFFFGFITIQILIGSFIISNYDEIIVIEGVKYGIMVVEIVFALTCLIFLTHNYKRRKEIVTVIISCNMFMRYEEENYYLEGMTINRGKSSEEQKIKNVRSLYKKHTYIIGYYFGIIGTTLGILIFLFSN